MVRSLFDRLFAWVRQRSSPDAAFEALCTRIEHRVLEGRGVESLLQAACDGLAETLGADSWAASVDAGVATRRAAAGAWPAALDPAALAATVLKTGAAAAAGRALAVPLFAGGDVAGVLAVRLPHSDAAVRAGLAMLSARLGNALRLANDQSRLRLLGAAIAATAAAVFIADRDGRIQWANDAFMRLSGLGRDAVVGRVPCLLGDSPEVRRVVESGRVWRGERSEQRQDGSHYVIEQTVTPMRDETGAVSHYVVVQEDITERREAEERISYLSNYDALTKLPNRNAFRTRLGEAVADARLGDRRLAVLFLDLEHFTRVNDSLGHEVGDDLLRGIVERVTAVAAGAHTIARIGGDEFAVVETEVAGPEAAAELAARLTESVTRPYLVEGHEVHIGSSIGIALFPEDGDDADELIKNADVAMYRAIKEAPNGFRFFSTEANAEMRTRLGLERELRRALGRGQFVLHYQPQLCVATGRILALEALLRWQHPELGLVSPGQFIPIAEQTGQILPVGEWVLREACAQIRRWQDAGVPVVPVAVNLSAAQLRQPGLAGKVREILTETKLNPSLLELELTESMVMHGEGAVGVLRDIEDCGVRLAIDDFGTGYSSLNYLKRFPVQKLKIDRSFVSELEHDPHDAEIARAIISLGHSLGLKVVSEGVETEAQLNYLRAEGCDQVQGFLFARPLAPNAAAAMLAARPFEQPLQT